jgi:pyruvate kinase
MSHRFLPLTARRSGAGPFQIVVTLGPASLDRIDELADAGASSFRLNGSHFDARALAATVAMVRRELPGAPIVVDLQGAKMRLGSFEARMVAAGEPVRFCLHAPEGSIPLPHPELFVAVHVGETLSCDDDRLRFRVTAISAVAIDAVALGAGRLRARQGVNRVEHPVGRDLGLHDLACLEALREVPGLSFALSFMRDGSEAEWLRRRMSGAVIGKVERAEAVASLAAIDASVDAIWICRGDLGAQLGPAALARAVAGFDPAAARAPMLMAGQVLEHLTSSPEPTRSEVCHLHDLIARGYSGIVLSDETAIGRDPVAAARAAVSLCDALLAA